MSFEQGQLVSQDLSPNAGIQGFQIADNTIQARNLAPGVIPTSAIVNGGNIFAINKVQTVSFSYTAGASPSSTTATITHNLGYIPIVFAEVNITTNSWSGGQIGIFGLPYITLGTSTISGTTFFTMLNIVKQMKIDTTTMTFEIGVAGSSATLAGTITAYILQQTSS